ncbi:response regulator transcription factor [Blastococcus sp. Marseille-P5729]|uniref:response regulator n=1 Tax=Blastococcus sp. Marseille-P5729 TaxID=2086582 RepID=UPI0018FE510C|nr:response regulator transcription factor [Blastococcus sp. Marseille-P5729]
MIRVALVDDQPLLRSGVAMALGSQPDIEVVWQADDGRQAVETNARDAADIVVMDVRMPVMDGIAATEAICRDQPQSRVLVLTTFDLDEHALDALRAGASGFLLKDAPAEELIAAVRHVASGEAVLAPATTARLVQHFVEGSARTASDQALQAVQAVGSLTGREREITRLIARGLTNPEIADELYLSETTVKTHVRAILRKLGARDRVQIVITAYEAGLV